MFLFFSIVFLDRRGEAMGSSLRCIAQGFEAPGSLCFLYSTARGSPGGLVVQSDGPSTPLSLVTKADMFWSSFSGAHPYDLSGFLFLSFPFDFFKFYLKMLVILFQVLFA